MEHVKSVKTLNLYKNHFDQRQSNEPKYIKKYIFKPTSFWYLNIYATVFVTYYFIILGPVGGRGGPA